MTKYRFEFPDARDEVSEEAIYWMWW